MKILKFNENISNKTWTLDKVEMFCNDYSYFVDNLSDYIKLKLKEEYDDYDDYDTDIYINHYFFIKGILTVEYNDDSGNDLTFQVDNMDEFITFLNDPDLLKNAKKYNL